MVRRAGAGWACGPAPDTPRTAALGRRSPCLTSLPRYQRTRTVRPGASPALPFPHAAEDGPVSTRPAGVGVGGKEHGVSLYRGTARHQTTPGARRGTGARPGLPPVTVTEGLREVRSVWGACLPLAEKLE